MPDPRLRVLQYRVPFSLRIIVNLAYLRCDKLVYLRECFLFAFLPILVQYRTIHPV